MLSALASLVPVCVACGESLGAADACLACLLRAGLDDAEATPELTRCGDFEIEQRADGSRWELGRGTMGVTYRAIDRVLGRTVALKVIMTPPTENAPALRERFLREARAAAALRHPNIAEVHQFGSEPENDRCYCAMELVEGETLEALVRREGPLSPRRALEIAIQVTRALVAAAERGLVHRDLKPANIMLTRHDDDLRAKVIDFGLAKAARAVHEMELTQGGFVGTPAFASPEQFAGGAIDARTDIYALGVTLWFALTGRLPFPGTTMEEIRERQAKDALPNEQLKARGIPRPLMQLLRSCLAVDPAARPASARELMAELEDCRARIMGRRRRRQLSLAALLAVSLASWWFLHKPTVPEDPSFSRVANSAMPPKPTEDPAAYLLFLRAREAELADDFRPALELYQQAVTLDPKFALARARLSIAATNLGRNENDAASSARGQAEAEEAVRLRPDLGEAHLALGTAYGWQDREPTRALAELNRAAVLLPTSAEVQLAAAVVHKVHKKFRERIAALRRAEAIDPRYKDVRGLLVLTFRWVRDWEAAIESLDRYAALGVRSPLSLFVSPWSRANDEFRLTGKIDVLKQALLKEAQVPAVPAERLNYERFEIAMFERDFENAARFLNEVTPESFDQSAGILNGVAGHSKPFNEALLAVARGAGNREKAEKLASAQKPLESALQKADSSESAQIHADLAIIDAFAGRKEEGIREATRARELCLEGGWIEGNDVAAALALVYAQTGEAEKAIDLIEHLLAVPVELERGALYNMTLTDLKWRWVWDPLRSHPRFQKLLAGPEPATLY